VTDTDHDGVAWVTLDARGSRGAGEEIVSYRWLHPRPGAAGLKTWVEKDGCVSIEAEDVACPLGEWVKHTDPKEHRWVGDCLGHGCLQFTGNKEGGGPVNSVLTFRVRIETAGTYSLALRGLEAPLESGKGDRANDCFARILGQEGWEGAFTKHVLLGPSFQWSWRVTGEPGHHRFRMPRYELGKGIHLLQVAGRSKNFFIDRLVLSADLAKLPAAKRFPRQDNRLGDLPPSETVEEDVIGEEPNTAVALPLGEHELRLELVTEDGRTAVDNVLVRVEAAPSGKKESGIE
jgi:hypothetical protein